MPAAPRADAHAMQRRRRLEGTLPSFSSKGGKRDLDAGACIGHLGSRTAFAGYLAGEVPRLNWHWLELLVTQQQHTLDRA